ncbi:MULTISPECIES: hypothetical protein [unclassified Plantibacter]|jgi:hypothetical protein|nr:MULTISPECIES: hypothetical protein [unclassified Plantibacter]
MSSDGPRPGPPHTHDDVKDAAKHDVPKPEEVDPETGTDAEGDPVENPSG